MIVYIFVLLLFVISPSVTQNVIGANKYSGGKSYCEPPPQPAQGGTYSLEGVPHPTIKNVYESFNLTYRCFTYYFMRNGDEVVQCKNGNWIYTIPECVHFQALYASTNLETTTTVKPSSDSCVIPPHPHGGRYTIEGNPNASPGSVFSAFQLTITCNYRFKLEGPASTLCVKGQWSGNLPQCVHISSGCDLRKHSSLVYHCNNDTHSFGLCSDEVPSGTTVQLRCKLDYEDPNVWKISTMYCIDGYWDSVAMCTPKAGYAGCQLYKHPSVEYRCAGDTPGYRVCNDIEAAGNVARIRCRTKGVPAGSSNSGHQFCVDSNWYHVTTCMPVANQNNAECGLQSGNRPLIFGGKTAVRGEVPWHVAIFSKMELPYKLICGGTLIRNSLILSAAHCFWDDLEGVLPPSNYAVAVGKLLRIWDDPRDIDAQTSDVKEVITPPLFQGNTANFQEDIALVRTTEPFAYTTYVRPVCLDFDFDLERRQLKKGNTGKVGGWGLTVGGSEGSPVLRTAEMPYVTQKECVQGTSPSFAAYITGDKICAGTNGTAVCRGDSGGGLTFRETKNGKIRFYIRGIVSTAPNSGEECDGTTWATFTNVNRHYHFIRDYL